MAKISINVSKGALQQDVLDETIIGIDLGTTNSLVAYIDKCSNAPVCIIKNNANTLVPSIIHFDEQGNIVIGEEAKKQLIAAPHRTLYSIKRLMGKSYTDVAKDNNHLGYQIVADNTESLVKIKIDNQFYSPIELSAFILKELKQIAEKQLNTIVTKAVITVPAYFNDAQRQATKDAGKLAGLNVLRIINEPTAASLAYGLGNIKSTEQTVAVYDLGGGTFDISILKIFPDEAGGIFEVLATNGDTQLGGDDIDALLTDFILQKINKTPQSVSSSQMQELRLMAEKAKKHLSHDNVYSDKIEIGEESFEINISKTELETIAQPLINKTLQFVKNALHDAQLTTADINTVLMVGGSTRMPLVKNTISQFFNKPVFDNINPDEVVALGAAIQANVLAGLQKNVLLLDVTPLSLGIETLGGLMDVLLPRNSKIPTKVARNYTTSKDGQTNLKIAIYQGERDLIQDNRKLAEFVLSGIPAMPAGLPKIEIQFWINADGILTVKASELRSGVAQTIEVIPQYGLTDEQVEAMLLASIENAKNDVAIRALIEAQTEAQQLVQVTNAFLNKNNSRLDETELQGTLGLIKTLESKIEAADKNEINEAMQQLNDFTRPFAERIMDIEISAALSGKTI